MSSQQAIIVAKQHGRLRQLNRRGVMGFPAKKIWIDGKLVPWDDAKIHIL